jgi:hypothetical protein
MTKSSSSGRSESVALNQPNVFWQAISEEHLRASHRYQALPQTQHIVITDAQQYRYVTFVVS